MRKSELTIGELYVVDHFDRAELLADLGYGDWKIRYLDPPQMGMEARVSSHRITRPWIPTAVHLKNRAGYSLAVHPGGEEHDTRLKELAAGLAEELERNSDQAIREIGWQLPCDEHDPEGQGLIDLSLPESMARQVLEALSSRQAQENPLGELLG